MSSKRERKQILGQIWATPTAYELDFFDKGDQLIVTSSYRDIAKWWISIMKVLYPQDSYREKGDLIKMKPGPGVCMKLNKVTGVMKIQGKNHWSWFVQNFADILEQGNADVDELVDQSDSSVTRYLQLNKNLEEVQDFIDMIPEGGGIMGQDFIMRLWKCLLDDWFGCGAHVYIVTPQIDAERLFSILLLMIHNKGTGFAVTLVTPQKAPDRTKFGKVFETAKRMMKKTRTPKRQHLVSDIKRQWALDSLEIIHENFSSNFIAAYKEHEAEILMTTAHFHKSHFNFNQKDSVTYSKMPTAELRRNYLLPLGIGQSDHMLSQSRQGCESVKWARPACRCYAEWHDADRLVGYLRKQKSSPSAAVESSNQIVDCFSNHEWVLGTGLLRHVLDGSIFVFGYCTLDHKT